MRIGILFGVRTHSSDPEVARELSLCPTMSIPVCMFSGSIPSLIVSAGFILGGAMRLLFVLAQRTLCFGQRSEQITRAEGWVSICVLRFSSRSVTL